MIYQFEGYEVAIALKAKDIDPTQFAEMVKQSQESGVPAGYRCGPRDKMRMSQSWGVAMSGSNIHAQILLAGRWPKETKEPSCLGYLEWRMPASHDSDWEDGIMLSCDGESSSLRQILFVIPVAG